MKKIVFGLILAVFLLVGVTVEALQLKVSWHYVSGAIGYKVYYSSNLDDVLMKMAPFVNVIDRSSVCLNIDIDRYPPKLKSEQIFTGIVAYGCSCGKSWETDIAECLGGYVWGTTRKNTHYYAYVSFSDGHLWDSGGIHVINFEDYIDYIDCNSDFKIREVELNRIDYAYADTNGDGKIDKSDLEWRVRLYGNHSVFAPD